MNNTQCFKITGVSSSGYYDWINRRGLNYSLKSEEDDKIKQMMFDVIKKISYIPGKRIFPIYIKKFFNYTVGEKRIRRLMKESHLVASIPKKDAYKGRATHYHVSVSKENYVNRDFLVGPRKVILTDITYLYYGEYRTVAYLCCFKDAFTNEILGFNFSHSMNVSLVQGAYDMMMNKHEHEFRNPECYIHSDSGSQYLCTSFKRILSDDDFIQSTSARGNSQDNAPMESFFSLLKRECSNIIALAESFDIANELVSGYIDSFNNVRVQINLAGLTPSEFYSYVTTGVYSLDSYFGVDASKLLSVDKLVNVRKECADKKAEKRRESRKEKKQCKDPLLVMFDDRKIISKLIVNNEKKISVCLSEIKFLNSILDKIDNSIKFFNETTNDIKEDLKSYFNWSKYEELSYVNDLGDLF